MTRKQRVAELQAVVMRLRMDVASLDEALVEELLVEDDAEALAKALARLASIETFEAHTEDRDTEALARRRFATETLRRLGRDPLTGRPRVRPCPTKGEAS